MGLSMHRWRIVELQLLRAVEKVFIHSFFQVRGGKRGEERESSRSEVRYKSLDNRSQCSNHMLCVLLTVPYLCVWVFHWCKVVQGTMDVGTFSARSAAHAFLAALALFTSLLLGIFAILATRN